MALNRLFSGIIPLTILSACCEPVECSPAIDMFAALLPVTEGLAAYQKENGHLPDALAAIFPEGLPSAITPFGGREQQLGTYLVQTPNGGANSFRYVHEDDSKAVDFRYTGPGFNFCNWAVDIDQWTCTGGY
jgi:hypothetical protein